uniref:Uncharacterized protein n=1 Tax=Clastoptera arizonana TaxID=38151 RepID=A0A1B6E6J7_9HEMI
MDGQNCTFGACGAVAGVKNPIALARSICDAQRMPLTLGRVPPCLLVGSGANSWAKENNITTVDPVTLISEKALKTNHYCKKKLAKYEAFINDKVSFENGLLSFLNLLVRLCQHLVIIEGNKNFIYCSIIIMKKVLLYTL